MKKVAGKLKLELSYFRELQAFAQFASDLDPATQARLTRGKIMVELLKQPNGKPLGFQKQATLIYAGINGYLDDIEVSQIRQFEQMINDKLDTSYSELNALMLKDKKLTGDIEDGIKKLVSEVVSEIKASA
jgi:F-type H+/Na+-transporting ATPase subunit alpha